MFSGVQTRVNSGAEFSDALTTCVISSSYCFNDIALCIMKWNLNGMSTNKRAREPF